jgi:hypothetical protein
MPVETVEISVVKLRLIDWVQGYFGDYGWFIH